jgi:hypothetical protein
MTISEAIETLELELACRKANADHYCELLSEAIEVVLDYAKRSAPR